MIRSAYVAGLSTREIDELVQSLGLTGVDKSTVSRIDGPHLTVRQNHRIVSVAVVSGIASASVGPG